MSVWETILYFVVPSVGVYALIGLLVARGKLARRPRYRVGQPWRYEPLCWTANPEGARLPVGDKHGPPPPGRRRTRRIRWPGDGTVTVSGARSGPAPPTEASNATSSDGSPAAAQLHPLRREIVSTQLVNEMVDGGRSPLPKEKVS